MFCRKCRCWMVEFLVETFSTVMEGQICPYCGFWVYKKTRKVKKKGENKRKNEEVQP